MTVKTDYKNAPPFSQKSCGDVISSEEARTAQLSMLKALAEYCDFHGLRYYLSGGTLLGAVRHKGFIPWDDDIDVNMPRPDIMKLMTDSNGAIGSFVLQGQGHDVFSKPNMWFRLYDTEILVENTGSGETFYHPLFIDIFPIDGMPIGKISTWVFCTRLILTRKFLGAAWHQKLNHASIKRRILFALSSIPAKIFGYSFWRDHFQMLCCKYDFDSHDYIGVTSTIVHIRREKVKKSDYLPSRNIQFENDTFSAPGCTDTYLTQLYNDYIQLPPPEKQQTDHKFRFYRNIQQ